MASDVVTVRLGPDVKDRLETLSRATRRSKSFLAAEAIERYLDEEAAFIAAVSEGLDQADRGEVVSHESVAAWIDSWGTGRERPKPEPE